MNILVPSGCMLFLRFMHYVHGCMHGSNMWLLTLTSHIHVHDCMHGSNVWLLTLTSHIHLHGC